MARLALQSRCWIRSIAAVILAAATISVCAQAPATPADTAAQLPSAPEPQPGIPLASVKLLAPPTDDSGEGKQSNASNPVGREPQDPPVVAMAPHPEDSIYWISGQANIIYQGRLPFHSLYEGPNSFRNSAEYKTSMVGTLYTALRRSRSIRYNTDLIFDLESGRGPRLEPGARFGWLYEPGCGP